MQHFLLWNQEIHGIIPWLLYGIKPSELAYIVQYRFCSLHVVGAHSWRTLMSLEKRLTIDPHSTLLLPVRHFQSHRKYCLRRCAVRFKHRRTNETLIKGRIRRKLNWKWRSQSESCEVGGETLLEGHRRTLDRAGHVNYNSRISAIVIKVW